MHDGFLAALTLAAIALVYPARSEEPNPGHAEALANMVRQDCGSCHGLTLKGGLGRPITSDALMAMDTDTVAAIVLDGIPGTAMPPWRGLVSDSDALWIARSLKEGRFE